MAQEIYRFDEFELDPSRRSFERDGSQIMLSPKAFEVLTYLVMNPGRVVTKDELLKAVWPQSFVEENNLTQHISSLRKALAEKANYIVTIPGRGYHFTPAVLEKYPTNGNANLQDDGVVVQRVTERAHFVVEQTTTAPADPLNVARDVSTSRLVSTRTAVWVGIVAVAAVLSVAGYFGYERFANPQQYRLVMVGDLLNTTGSPVMDSARSALITELSQSPDLQLLGGGQIHGLLRMMGKPVDTPLLGDIALEVCRRSNFQALVRGRIDHSPLLYKVELEVVNCLNGRTLATYKGTATNQDPILDTLDGLAKSVRRKLGESNDSLDRHSVPIMDATTFSFEALNDLNIGSRLGNEGKLAECIPYFQKAIAIDPRFAAALHELGVAYYNLSEFDKSAEYLKKAYDLSDGVSDQEKFEIQADYHLMVEGDLPATIASFREGTQNVPEDYGYWLSLANAELQIGDPPRAIEAAEMGAKNAYESSEITYQLLAMAYKRANRYADAKRAVAVAQAQNEDGMPLHDILFDIALVEQDQDAQRHELAWGQGKNGDYQLLEDQAILQADKGNYRRFESLMPAAMDGALKDVGPDYVDSMRGDEANVESQLGRASQATAFLRQIKNKSTLQYAVLSARSGDLATGEAFLRKKEEHPKNTIEHFLLLPELRALVSLRHGAPQAAVDALEPARPYELAQPEVIEVRAQAYLAAHQPDKAAIEFKKLIANPTLEDPTLPRTLLAHVGLARAYRQSDDLGDSRHEYETFLALWQDADPDLPILKEAKQEYAALK